MKGKKLNLDDFKWSRQGGYKWRKFRANLISKRGHKCQKCGVFTLNLIADHIKPIFLGGKEFDEDNIQLLCEQCNKKKTSSDLSISSWLNLL